MKIYSVEITIETSPQTIWKILTNAAAYPEWEPNVERIEGQIAKGEKIKVFTKFSPGRAFPATISSFVPNEQMVWSGGMPLGLFKGVRTFELTPNGDGGTDFSMKEVFSGLLLPLIGRTIPDLTENFQQFAEGLKERAEAGE